MRRLVLVSLVGILPYFWEIRYPDSGEILRDKLVQAGPVQPNMPQTSPPPPQAPPPLPTRPIKPQIPLPIPRPRIVPIPPAMPGIPADFEFLLIPIRTNLLKAGFNSRRGNIRVASLRIRSVIAELDLLRQWFPDTAPQIQQAQSNLNEALRLLDRNRPDEAVRILRESEKNLDSILKGDDIR
ncbi:MAG TPA: hypothetical protein VNM22_13975 [Candidatus Limnocylindrales bacterium]|nr:hypothetical protein [Candidatus Limnocylindrales bacterium]